MSDKRRQKTAIVIGNTTLIIYKLAQVLTRDKALALVASPPQHDWCVPAFTSQCVRRIPSRADDVASSTPKMAIASTKGPPFYSYRASSTEPSKS